MSVIGFDDLLAANCAAGRPQDLLDVETLESFRRGREANSSRASSSSPSAPVSELVRFATGALPMLFQDPAPPPGPA